jgi:hypothetical protein
MGGARTLLSGGAVRRAWCESSRAPQFGLGDGQITVGLTSRKAGLE